MIGINQKLQHEINGCKDLVQRLKSLRSCVTSRLKSQQDYCVIVGKLPKKKAQYSLEIDQKHIALRVYREYQSVSFKFSFQTGRLKGSHTYNDQKTRLQRFNHYIQQIAAASKYSPCAMKQAKRGAAQ